MAYLNSKDRDCIFQNDIFLWSFLLILIFPGLYYSATFQMSGDVAWYISGLRDILQGKKMVDWVFDTNSPISYFIYFPAELISHLGISIWYAVDIYCGGVAAAAFYMTFRLLKSWKNIETVTLWGMLAAFIVGTLFFTSLIATGQKDTLVALVLFPCLLAQFDLTYEKVASSRIRSFAILLSIPFILTKPHWGLLPFVMVIHRFCYKKSWKVFFDIDCFGFALASALYMGCVFLFFQDYVSIILPIGFEYYISQELAQGSEAMKVGVFLPFLLVLLFFVFEKSIAERKLERESRFLLSISLMSAIPFFAQIKGYESHLIPEFGIILPSILFFLAGTKENPLLKIYQPQIFVMILVLGGGYLKISMYSNYRSHQNYIEKPLVQLLTQKGSNTSFFMQSDELYYTETMQFYTGMQHASRFAQMGYVLPYVIAANKKGDFKNRDFFASLFAKDLEMYKPSLILLYANAQPDKNLVNAFGGYRDFDVQWKKYQWKGQWAFDYQKHYNMEGEVIYDVYELK